MRIVKVSKNGDKTVFLKDRFVINGKKYEYENVTITGSKKQTIINIENKEYCYEGNYKKIKKIYTPTNHNRLIIISLLTCIMITIGLLTSGFAEEKRQEVKPINYMGKQKEAEYKKAKTEELLKEKLDSEFNGIQIEKEIAEKERIRKEKIRKQKEKEEQRIAEENREKQKWEYFEQKDYGITKKSTPEERIDALIKYAKDHIGVKYVYGGGSWQTGVDCSGFTMLCYRKFGVPMPHYSGSQATFGKAVSDISEAKAGDLIRYYGHIAIYLGNNKIIHASPPSVCIGNDATYSKIRSIRRIFY